MSVNRIIDLNKFEHIHKEDILNFFQSIGISENEMEMTVCETTHAYFDVWNMRNNLTHIPRSLKRKFYKVAQIIPKLNSYYIEVKAV